MLIHKTPEIVIYSTLAEVLGAWDLADAQTIACAGPNWFQLAAVAGVSALVSQIATDLEDVGAGACDPLREEPIGWISDIVGQEVGLPRVLASGFAVRLVTDALNVPTVNSAFFALSESRRVQWATDWARLASAAYSADVFRDLIGRPARAAGELSAGFQCFWDPLARLLDEQMGDVGSNRLRVGAFPLSGDGGGQTVRLPGRTSARAQGPTVGPMAAYPYLHRLAELHANSAVPVSAALAIEDFAAAEVWRHRGKTIELTGHENRAAHAARMEMRVLEASGAPFAELVSPPPGTPRPDLSAIPESGELESAASTAGIPAITPTERFMRSRLVLLAADDRATRSEGGPPLSKAETSPK